MRKNIHYTSIKQFKGFVCIDAIIAKLSSRTLFTWPHKRRTS